MKPLLTLGLLAALTLSPGEEAIDIATRFEREKIAALESYLEASPDAKDRDTALRILVSSYSGLGEHRPVPDLLLQRYELFPKTGDPNLQTLLAEIARPLVEAAISSGQRDKGKAFLTRVRTDFGETPAGPQILGFLEQLGADLYLPGVGDEMTLAFSDLNGGEVDLATMRDQVILVDFWATWCAPCVAALPELLEAYETFHEEGFEVIGISLDESRAELEGFLRKNEIPWPQYFDAQGGENELAQRFGIRRIPASFLVGKGGRIVAADLHGEALFDAIRKELAREP